VTQLSKSKMRSVAAIGDSCVIPAKAGIQVWIDRESGDPAVPANAGIQVWVEVKMGSRFRGNDES
jgi:hypothetical protein